MTTMPRTTRFATLFAGLLLAFSMVAMDHAEARRGGSFGSRGARTSQSAPATPTAPQPAAPVERSMTPNTGQSNTGRQAPAAASRPGFMNGFGGSMLRGLALGGLIGLLLGQGFGGMAGMFGFLLQALLIGGLAMLAIRMFRSRSAQSPVAAMAGNSSAPGNFSYREAPASSSSSSSASGSGYPGFPGFGSRAQTAARSGNADEIGLTQQDRETFERLLAEVQDAFGREDHAGLRRLATPEMVSYFSEELAENAKNGVRNDVSDVKLLQADIAESWSEGDRDYATAALRYASRDVTVDRADGSIVEGNADQPTETTELWTFTRQNGSDWKLSAIQEA
ncbi:Tim44 domain-containing protein [Phyllobacterium leguminum]|uniref:Putative lipid-binding transport protein (Tim44 family) n=1 Tax=Phyllobacterium leguminum TaxID=314237 RepID=A0A318T3J0_9HYPH|nr:Tim44 domain-containing protein [Phyllobacterium leguminum]PYE86592.1 putative lipid-binding transport protein (Tim44 family) [Phyllobacterium leguminum]